MGLSVAPTTVQGRSSAPERQGSLGERPLLSNAQAAASALATADPSGLWSLGSAEVSDSLSLLEEVRARAERLQVAVMAEARSRGLGRQDGWGAVD
jgi:hypothetical protein